MISFRKQSISQSLFLLFFTVSFLTVIPTYVTAETHVRFAAIGDYGSGSLNEGDVANLIDSWNVDFVITAGDNRYGNTTFDEVVGQFYCDFLKDAKWGAYCSDPIRTSNAFFPSLGNHDYDDGGGVNEYLNYFTLPGNERYYDFVRGPVHFFAINSDSQEPDGTRSSSVQAQWLKNQLAASTTPWQIVYFHHAAYSSGLTHGSTAYMRWPFAAWGADVVIAGHDHTYERINLDGIVYFVNGLGGKSKYNCALAGSRVTGSQVCYDDDYGAMLIEASESNINFQFINRAGIVIDNYNTDGFIDVPPSHWAYNEIMDIYEAGITTGCSTNPLKYCPLRDVNRAQMAVFLERGINDGDYSPPPSTGIFDDVPVTHWAADWIEQLYEDDITTGCAKSPLKYCPDRAVNRAQMAVFLLRSKHGSNYTPPQATGIFDDVPITYWAVDWIEQLYKEGITSGCSTNPLKYCPLKAVNRAQMAVFLDRTFGF